MSEPVTGQTITRAQLLRLRDAVEEEMRWLYMRTDEYKRLEILLRHVSTALGWRRPTRGESPTRSLDACAEAWNERHP